MHGMRLPLGALLVVRAFELWIHDNDIRRWPGCPLVPDGSTLRLMTELAARMLPYGATLTGLREPVSLHLVLTGPGGGTWDVTVGSGPGIRPRSASSPTLSGSAAGGQPGDAADLDLHVTGDPGRAAEVLAAAAALALD